MGERPGALPLASETFVRLDGLLCTGSGTQHAVLCANEVRTANG